MLFFRLLEGAVGTGPTTLWELIKVPNPHPVPTPPPTVRVWPESLAAQPLHHPWRNQNLEELLP